MFWALRALVLAVWALWHPGIERSGFAGEIASAITIVVIADGARAPVMGSHAEDAVLMAVYAYRESSLREGLSGDEGRSWGVWQLPAAAGKLDVISQARAWLVLLHRGAIVCPKSPAAPLAGGCAAARRVADRRAATARKLLTAALARRAD